MDRVALLWSVPGDTFPRYPTVSVYIDVLGSHRSTTL